jgi:hypothetical protein
MKARGEKEAAIFQKELAAVGIYDYIHAGM